MDASEDKCVTKSFVSESLAIVSVDQLPTECISVPKDDLNLVFATAQQMERLCRKHDGVGLAAPQVGVPWSLFIAKKLRRDRLEIISEPFEYYIDCQYAPVSDEKIESTEGCLSLPGKLYVVPRFRHVEIKGYRLTCCEDHLKIVPLAVELNIGYDYDGIDLLNHVVFQHELDHIFGILISDIGKPLGEQNVK